MAVIVIGWLLRIAVGIALALGSGRVGAGFVAVDVTVRVGGAALGVGVPDASGDVTWQPKVIMARMNPMSMICLI